MNKMRNIEVSNAFKIRENTSKEEKKRGNKKGTKGEKKGERGRKSNWKHIHKKKKKKKKKKKVMGMFAGKIEEKRRHTDDQ